jgi:hypothetical protein
MVVHRRGGKQTGLRWLARLGREQHTVEYVVPTYSDRDHIGTAGSFPPRSDDVVLFADTPTTAQLAFPPTRLSGEA